MSDNAEKPTVAERLQRAAAADATAIRHSMETTTGTLPPAECLRLAGNLARLLLQAKQAGIAMREIVKAAGIAADQVKPENTLARYRVIEGGKRKAPPKLASRVKGYLALALAVASRLRMLESEAVLQLAEGTRFVADGRADGDSLEPAARVFELLRLRLRVLIAERGLDAYFRDVDALHATPTYGDKGVEDWSCDFTGIRGAFERHHWPSVLMTGVVRDTAPARLSISGKETSGKVAWIEKVYLTIGPGPDHSARPYLEFHSYMSVMVNGGLDLLKMPVDGWLKPGYPPPEGAERFNDQLVFEIQPGRKLAIPEEYVDEERRVAAADPYENWRLERLDLAVLSRWFSEMPAMRLARQSLSDVDSVGLFSPPRSALAKIEGALLKRDTYDPEDPTFIEELDRRARDLVSSFETWRSAAREKAIADHQRLTGEWERRLAELSAPGTSADPDGAGAGL